MRARQKAGTLAGWLMALSAGVAVAFLLWLSLLLVPHLLLTRLLMLTRGVRVTLATLWIALATISLLTLAARVGAPREES